MRNLNIKIPGFKGRSRAKRAPWVLRHCPESQRGLAVRLFSFTGGIAYMILFFAAFLFIAQTPLLVAAAHPDSLIGVPIRWLRAHFSHDSSLFIYGLVPLSITFILVYAIIVFDYIRHDATDGKKREDA
jgi:hypothetical protein